ncbi:hypothetical protein F5146DRAFT_1125139, partial [Armillaria mellea]
MPKSKKSCPTLARHTPRDDPPYDHLIRNNNEPLNSETAKKRLAEQANRLQPEAREESKALRALIKTCTKIIHPSTTTSTVLGPTAKYVDDGETLRSSYPSLWSELSVPSNCGSYWRHVENPIGRLKLWLHRSRSVPLRILYGGLGRHGPKEHEIITSLLFQQSERWEVFRWIGCSDPGRFERLSEVVERVPLLRHLDVQYFIAGGPQEATTAASFAGLTVPQPRLVRFHAERFLVDPFKLLGVAPNLEDLALDCALSPLTICVLSLSSSGEVGVPFTKLVVQGRYRFQQSLVLVLRASPILEDLTLVGDESMPLYHYQRSILEQLTFREGIPDVLPALKTFSCDVRGIDSDALVTMLECRCERGHLRKVTLWSAQTPVKEWETKERVRYDAKVVQFDNNLWIIVRITVFVKRTASVVFNISASGLSGSLIVSPIKTVEEVRLRRRPTKGRCNVVQNNALSAFPGSGFTIFREATNSLPSYHLVVDRIFRDLGSFRHSIAITDLRCLLGKSRSMEILFDICPSRNNGDLEAGGQSLVVVKYLFAL